MKRINDRYFYVIYMWHFVGILWTGLQRCGLEVLVVDFFLPHDHNNLLVHKELVKCPTFVMDHLEINMCNQLK